MSSNQKKILITGGSGYVGNALTRKLIACGFQAAHLSRKPSNPDASVPVYHWNVDNGELDKTALENTSTVIHLAGAPVIGKRWTAAYKRELYDSRVKGLNLLFEAIKNNSYPVKTLISASAIGYYGNCGEQAVDETAPAGMDFLSRLCVDWESSAWQFRELGIRTCIIRIGIVIGKGSGLMATLTRTAPFGFIIIPGEGSQIISWIHIEDLANAMLFLLQNESLTGTFNGVSPNPVSLDELVKALETAMNKQLFKIHVPEWLLRLGLGEAAASITGGCKVLPVALQKAGFTHEFQDIKSALAVIF